jgi:S1-C subfamily serine protease
MLAILLIVVPTVAQARSAMAPEPVPNGIVKIRAIHNHPNFVFPWQRRGAHTVTGSGVIIEGGRILTNAHVVEDHTIIEVERQGTTRRYTAQLATACHPCDLALLTVEDEAFFEGAEPVNIGPLPPIQSQVSVYGFPEGGESISVTAGIISRVEVGIYSHSSRFLLRGQIDAAINAGNSGGPVMSDGEIVGIAMATREAAENIGYMVPAPVVEHFLEDVGDGLFDGFPDLGIYYQPIENGSLRKELGLAGREGGVLVIGVAQRGPAADRLRPGDVLLSYDGYEIDRNGSVTLDDGLRVDCTYLEQSKQAGDALKVRFLRNGEEHQEKIQTATVPRLIPIRRYDTTPEYFIFAGLVFQPLTGMYLREFRFPPARLGIYQSQFTFGPYRSAARNATGDARREIVVITSILTDELNRGYASFEDAVIEYVNDERIHDLAHLVRVVENAKGPYLKLVTESGLMMALDLEQARGRGAAILANYGIRNDRSAGLPTIPAAPAP